MPITIIPSKEYWYDVGVQLGIQQEKARSEKEKLETIRKLIDAGLEEDILRIYSVYPEYEGSSEGERL